MFIFERFLGLLSTRNGLAAFGLLVFLPLTVSQGVIGDNTHTKGSTKQKSDPNYILVQDIKKGKDLFKAYECAACHSIGGQGCKDGISLDKEGVRRSEKFIAEQLKDPEAHVSKYPKSFTDSTSSMPTPNLEQKEIRLIAKYLFSLK